VSEEGFELMDGQQRTISICQYVSGDYSVTIDGSPYYFSNLTADRQKQILDYELSIYVCDGEDQEKLDWFRIINIAGKPLTDQELRNAIYTGPWLADAKKWFSRTGCPAYQIGEKYVQGSPIRQDFLEEALDWISNKNWEQYMAEHQHDSDAQELWLHFQSVIDWVKRIFPTYRAKYMKNQDWGGLYREYGNRSDLNPAAIEEEIARLLEDDEVNNKSGIYNYVLSRNENKLNLRAFDDKTKQITYDKQKGICPSCKKEFPIEKMEADHIVPWSKGGGTVADNCRMLCLPCNRSKSGK